MSETQESPKPVEETGGKFRLYIDDLSLCCKFFTDQLERYPAVEQYLEVWHVNLTSPTHKIQGVPCIVDSNNDKRVWLGSTCLDWLKMAVHYSATQIPLKIPSSNSLKSGYNSSSTSSLTQEGVVSVIISPSLTSEQSSSSELLDSNQEDSEFIEDPEKSPTKLRAPSQTSEQLTLGE